MWKSWRLNNEKKELECMDLEVVNKFSLKTHRTYVAKVTRVIDGDTFKCVLKPYPHKEYYSFSIRLLNYDSPEIRGCSSEEKELGLLAKAYMMRLVEGKCVYLLCDDFDCFGRILAHVFLDEKREDSVNERMISYLAHQDK